MESCPITPITFSFICTIACTLLDKINRPTIGTSKAYLINPILEVLFLFIIIIRFFKGETLNLFII